jgi:hypothetical protein
MVVLYFSISESFNPFTLSRPRFARRRHTGDATLIRPRYRAVRGATPRALDASSTQLPGRTAEEILAMLPALAGIVAEVETDLRRWVVRLRDLGVGWDLIGAALQLGEEEARQRFDGGPQP